MQTKNYISTPLVSSELGNRSQNDRPAKELDQISTADGLEVADAIISDLELSRALAAKAGVEWVDLSAKVIATDVISQLTAEDARRFKIIPVGLSETGLIVAVTDPFDIETIDALSFLLQREIDMVCTSQAEIRQALIKYYGTADEASELLLQQIGHEVEITPDMAREDAGVTDPAEAPVIRMVSMLLLEAYRLGASDIHLEPLDKKFRVRFRIDGALQEMPAPPKRLQSAIISRLKIMTSSMSIAERRLPQDGRIQIRIGKAPVDLRVSTIPTNHGESIVIRVLDRSAVTLSLAELGLFREDQERVERLLCSPDGIFLVTGPTGSGKTTTLYSCLNFINKPDRKIITVEEPIEYLLSGINQVQVSTDIGLTFPVALRSILRQAPNIIMIGEIRDLETAMIAMNASLTGHLVFSTLHTNDASSAVARLIDIGLQPFLVTSAVRAIMAQRLVRRLCPHCRQPGELTQAESTLLDGEQSRFNRVQVMLPIGCEHCRHTGYKGRVAVFEIVTIDDEVRRLINNRSSIAHLRQYVRQRQMRSLLEDGACKVFAGLTSAEEVITALIGNVK